MYGRQRFESKVLWLHWLVAMRASTTFILMTFPPRRGIIISIVIENWFACPINCSMLFSFVSEVRPWSEGIAGVQDCWGLGYASPRGKTVNCNKIFSKEMANVYFVGAVSSLSVQHLGKVPTKVNVVMKPINVAIQGALEAVTSKDFEATMAISAKPWRPLFTCS